MAWVIREGKKRRTPLLVVALLVVTVGVLVGGGTFSWAASTSPSVSNYSQCANGAPNKTPPNDKTTCNQGWINGILNANNSQYAENDATAQRFVLTLPSGAPGGASNQKFTLKYLWNKANNHAYDSLVKWNNTITGVTTGTAFCAGISGTCPAAGTSFNGGNGQDQLVVFGPAGTDITNITVPQNDSSTCSLSADEYETLEVDFTVPSLPATVLFAFGGHLACGTNRTGCWGSGSADTNGASNINGGPYHIKLLTVDGTSAGNQDNQIMSSAILPLTVSALSTTPAGTPTTVPATWSASIHDSATVTGSSPTGTVTFNLYAPGDTTCSTSIYSDTETLSSGSATSGNFTDIGSSGTYGAGTYQWVVSYSGDANNSDSSSSCGDTSEQETVTGASTTDATTSP
jgi:hypothetical protein